MRTGAVLAVGVLILAAVLSGSYVRQRTAIDADEFVEVCAALDASLERAGERLGELAAGIRARDDTVPAALRAEIDELAERRLVIVRTIDSLSQTPGDSWRGAMPGLRASVTDLEARIDRVALASVDSVEAVDRLLRMWLAEVQADLGGLDRAADRSSDFGAWADELAAMRQTKVAIAERLARFTDIDDDPRLRDDLADELITLRRRLRALERAAGSLAQLRLP